VRMQMMGLSIVSMAQGVPFFHAGSEVLRSKSMEADSYNAGDWFNRLDWTYRTDNFAVGLPSAEKNRDRWSIIGPLLARPEIRPGEAHIRKTLAHFKEMVSIRASSPLFRLRTAADVIARVRFHNTGPGQTPGLIVMSITDEGAGLVDLDPSRDQIVVVFNATAGPVTYGGSGWEGLGFELHPILQDSADEVVRAAAFDGDHGTFTVPARTTAVFVR
jgi:pullulanase